MDPVLKNYIIKVQTQNAQSTYQWKEEIPVIFNTL